MIRRAACVVLVASLWLLAAGQPSAEPVTLRDALGRTVTLPAPPQRIVTIFASNTEMVAALGLAERIVGIEAFTRYPPEVQGKPLVGGRLGFSVDEIVRQRPDLVVVTPARQAAHQLVDPMERIGVPVIVLQHATVAEVLANIRLLGLATGERGRADELAARLRARIDAVQSLVAEQRRPRTVMITGRVGNGLLLVARPGTYTGDAIALSGGRFALQDRGLVPQVSPEAILDADPDTLLFAGSPRDLEELVSRPGWRGMRAVQARRVHAFNRAEFLIPGPRTVDGIERLARLLHAQALQR